MSLGREIKRRREEQGMTQEELAEKINLSRQAISKWEADISRPSGYNMKKLSLIFEADFEKLISEVNDETDENAVESDREESGNPDRNEKKEFPPAKNNRLKAPIIILSLLCVTSICILCSVLILNKYKINSAADGKASPEASYQDAKENNNGEKDEDILLHNSEEERNSSDTADSAAEIPDRIALEKQHLYDFSENNLGEYDDTLVSEQDIREGMIFSQNFRSSDCTLTIIRNNKVIDNGSEFYDVYVLYKSAETDGKYKILMRIAEANVYTGSLGMFNFENTLGYSGYKIFVEDGAASAGEYYFTLGASGKPELKFIIAGDTAEADVDMDGEKEILVCGLGGGYEIYDREDNDYYQYTITQESLKGLWFEFDKSRLSYIVKDTSEGNQGAVLATYSKLSDSALQRDASISTGQDSAAASPGISEEAYADVKDTVLTFVLDQFSDGRDPDAVLKYAENGNPYPTYREQAYLALQELYDLTGIKLERCYALATGYSICFSLERDGFDKRSFYSACLGEDYGCEAVSSINIAYREEASWSPISVDDIRRPEHYEGMSGEEIAVWSYNQMNILHKTDIVTTGLWIDGETIRMYMEDGSFFEAEIDKKLSALISLHGPYEAGFEH